VGSCSARSVTAWAASYIADGKKENAIQNAKECLELLAIDTERRRTRRAETETARSS
jgi:hypothetical protein